ncbi:MAG: hypothetical protein Q9M10_01105 [Mariprofundaceae bacterium]|nr:hypothetical protein [Mariprofundaceae bacterium]
MFVMLVWLVQQSKLQSAQLRSLALQERQLAEKLSVRKVKHVQQVQPQPSQTNTPTPKKPVGNLPKDAQKLLEKALDEARQMRKLAKSGAYAEAGGLIKSLKGNIWQASDMLPQAKKEALRKLMGVLDYNAAQLKLRKTGDTKKPVHTIKNILDGKNG